MSSNDPRSVLGAQFEEFEDHGFSQEALAEICGLHRTYIGGIERGERNVRLLNIVAIAHSLKVQPRGLLVDIA